MGLDEGFSVKLRTLALAALASALAFGTAGCGMITPEGTTVQANEDRTSDGQNAQDDDVAIRNAILITSGEGLAALSVTFVNDGDTQVATLELDGQVAQFEATVGVSMTEPGDVVFASDVMPGDLVDIEFQIGTGDSVIVAVPVLDGELPEYAPFAVVTPAA